MVNESATGPRNRAPLGIKTTNAKTKVFQTPALDKDLGKTQVKATSTRRSKPKTSQTETVKLSVSGDDTGPLEEREVEYAPPKSNPLPYDSEDFPDGHLKYDMLKGPNLMRGWQRHYFNPTDENGVNLKEKQYEAECAQAMSENDKKILRAIEETDWSVGDVPETFANFRRMKQNLPKIDSCEPTKKSALQSRRAGTIDSRKAASALSVAPRVPHLPKVSTAAIATKPTYFLKRPRNHVVSAPSNPAPMLHTAAAAASRSTIGYKKGRNASTVLTKRTGTLSRSISNLSSGSDTTITPARFAQIQDDDDEWRRLKFLGAFDINEDDLEPCLKGALPECLRGDDDADEEFVMTLNP